METMKTHRSLNIPLVTTMLHDLQRYFKEREHYHQWIIITIYDEEKLLRENTDSCLGSLSIICLSAGSLLPH
jgi:hypothetical protein